MTQNRKFQIANEAVVIRYNRVSEMASERGENGEGNYDENGRVRSEKSKTKKSKWVSVAGLWTFRGVNLVGRSGLLEDGFRRPAVGAALLAVYHYNQTGERKIGTVTFPAMGTGFGNVPYSEAARQMAAAYRHFLNPPQRIDWDWVIDRHRAISYDGKRQVAST